MRQLKKIVLLSVILGVMGWLYYTPYQTVSQIHRAIEEKNMGKLDSYIDYPLLRQNVQANIQANLNEKMGQAIQENPLAAMARTIADKMATTLVDAIVSKDGVHLLLQGRDPLSEMLPKPAKIAAVESTTNRPSAEKSQPEFSSAYVGLNQFQVKMQRQSDSNAQVVFTLERFNLVSWKLVNIQFDDH